MLQSLLVIKLARPAFSKRCSVPADSFEDNKESHASCILPRSNISFICMSISCGLEWNGRHMRKLDEVGEHYNEMCGVGKLMTFSPDILRENHWVELGVPYSASTCKLQIHYCFYANICHFFHSPLCLYMSWHPTSKRLLLNLLNGIFICSEYLV